MTIKSIIPKDELKTYNKFCYNSKNKKTKAKKGVFFNNKKIAENAEDLFIASTVLTTSLILYMLHLWSI